MTRKEFKEKYLDNAFYWVNKGNFMDLQEILQDFGFKCHTGEGFIHWHDGFKSLVTFPTDKFHGFEYYQKADVWLPNARYGEAKNYEDMIIAHSELS